MTLSRAGSSSPRRVSQTAPEPHPQRARGGIDDRRHTSRPLAPPDRRDLTAAAFLSVGLLVSEILDGTQHEVRVLTGLGLAVLAVTVSAVSVAVAVTARRESDRRAQVIEAASRTSREWVWEADVAERITYSNDAVLDLLGYFPQEVLGRTLSSSCGTTRRGPRHGPTPTEPARPGPGWEDVELQWRRKDGSGVMLQGSAVPLHGHSGNVIGFRGTRRLVDDRSSAAAAAAAGPSRGGDGVLRGRHRTAAHRGPRLRGGRRRRGAGPLPRRARPRRLVRGRRGGRAHPGARRLAVLPGAAAPRRPAAVGLPLGERRTRCC